MTDPWDDCIFTYMLDFCGINVGKFTVVPWIGGCECNSLRVKPLVPRPKFCPDTIVPRIQLRVIICPNFHVDSSSHQNISEVRGATFSLQPCGHDQLFPTSFCFGNWARLKKGDQARCQIFVCLDFLHPRNSTAGTWKFSWYPIRISFSKGPFSGSMFVLGGVSDFLKNCAFVVLSW